MKIIGHRGAAGLALENTKPSLLKALELGVDGIEFDIHKTSDGVLILSHDPDLKRVSGLPHVIAEHTHIELKEALEAKGIELLQAEEALKLILPVPVIIDMKATGCTEELKNIISRYPGSDITISSLHYPELLTLQQLLPNVQLSARGKRPIATVNFAKKHKLQGITFNVWFFNPLTYVLARKAKLSIRLFTINHPLVNYVYYWFGKFTEKFYPGVDYCTDRPDLFIKNRDKP